ncbi:peroxiredoxin [Phragmitibacter flavus]|uniref:thioredoxin-dependent peroxiredoxin n=1 Tax=Phragmitibacter flavus TaxID=2576071 RepID=A0A5R8K8C6_9BACT|nr:peroxiredoxin [Phragmitibacter flavus]TLD68597.1 peroxiredoxin [Phragmitibacter flavus]
MKKFLTFISAMSIVAATSLHAGQGVKIDPPVDAPAIEATDQNGKTVKLAETYQATPYVAVFFYPKADTPGCTKQACAMRDSHADLAKAGISVIGVSADTVEAQKKFSDKYNFPYPLLADPEGKVIDAFAVTKNDRGMATRQAFIIKNGKVVWHDPKASTEDQAIDIIKAVQSLE